MKAYKKTARLIFRYIRRELSYLEEKKLTAWRSLSAANEVFFQEQTSPEYIRDTMRNIDENTAEVLERLRASYPPDWVQGRPRKRARVIYMLKMAAAIIGFVIATLGAMIGYEYYFNEGSPTNFAMITTINGQRRFISDFQMGKHAGFRGMKVEDKGYHDMIYTISNQRKAVKGQMDSTWTAEDWRLELHLPEGSRIWLNHSSWVGYPQNFMFSDSVLYQVGGEAYFQIPYNTKMYYEIRTNSLLIRPNDAELDVRTDARTGGQAVLLVSGSATVSILKPIGDSIQTLSLHSGQQVRLVDGQFILDEHPNIPGITEWKK